MSDKEKDSKEEKNKDSKSEEERPSNAAQRKQYIILLDGKDQCGSF